ncbi:hypothetical protein C9426_30955, partial [Serratia sp. S1B]
MYKLYINKVQDGNSDNYILIKNKKIKHGLIECFFEIFEDNKFVESVEGVYCYYNYLEEGIINLDNKK